MSTVARWTIALASALILSALALPLWRIQLVAPQYPEGLGMVIRANTVSGASAHDLQSINSLNHYIGMKAIEPAQITELRVIPWLIAGLAAAGVIVALVGRKTALIAWLLAFAAAGAIGLWDFYRWEYSYGHDLDIAHAIIKVPGMVYQPPLIGSKQLLNFTAVSLPAAGTYAIGAAFVLAAAVFVLGNFAPSRRAPVTEAHA
jgi:copper chaperone NosL